MERRYSGGNEMQMMKPLICSAVAGLFLAACGLASARPDGEKSDAPVTSFGRFKSLVGDWTGTGGTVRFKLSSGGSVVEEVYFPDTKQEMINMITRDGSKVVLVHYCMVGNQPRMMAPDKVSGNSTAFKFVSAGNMKSEADMHMRTVTFTFVDSDTLKEKWITYKDGKPMGGPQEFVHKRKKVMEK
jgi:hypothetical protein